MNKYEYSLLAKCIALGNLSNWYAEEMPEDFAIPCIYFPPAVAAPGAHSLNAYEGRKVIYAKIFARTRRQAGEIAETISDGLMKGKRIVPVLKADTGKESGETFKIGEPLTNVIEDGVAQITLSYRLYQKYTEDAATKIQNLNLNEYLKNNRR